MASKGKSIARHWIPRLLGITPLLVLCLGLFNQGGPLRGLLMVVVLVLIMATLLVLYAAITHLVQPIEEPSNPLFRRLYRRLTSLINKSPDELSWPAETVQYFLKAITSSPYSGLGSLTEDLEYKSNQAKEMNLPIEAELNPGYYRKQQEIIDSTSDNQSIGKQSDSSTQEVEPAKDVWKVVKINGQSIDLDNKNNSAKIVVDGGTLIWTYHAESPSQLLYIPSENSSGRYQFICTAKRGDWQSENAEYSFPVYVNIQSSGPHAGGWLGLQTEMLASSKLVMRSVRWLMYYLLQLRIQVAIAILCYLLFQTQQVKDVLLAMILDQETRAFAWATAFGIALSLLLWHSSRQLTRMFPEIRLSRRRMTNSSNSRENSTINQGIFSLQFELVLFWLSWFSIVLFMVPIAKEAFDGSSGSLWQAQLLLPYCLFIAWAILIGLWHFPNQPRAWRKNYSRTFGLLFLAGLALPFGFQFIPANVLPQYFGSVAVLFWALSIYLIVTTTIFRFSVASGFPLLTLLLIGSYFFNINRVNDNHAVRLRPSEQGETKYAESFQGNPGLPPIEEAFIAWLNSNETRIQEYLNNNEKYFPVYVVSAQGGGIYAAYHTAKTLSRLSDEVPGFENQVFAISAVSGGSIGSTIYAMALRSQVDSCRQSTLPNAQPARLGERIESYFNERDALATILASLLFGDITQRFFPLAIPSWDRALGLELGFENRYAGVSFKPVAGQIKCFEPIHLNGSFYLNQDYRMKEEINSLGGQVLKGQTASAKSYPNLVLNTTEVENGRRYILAPFVMDEKSTDADFHQPWRKLPEKRVVNRDLRFSTAAGLSARFPIASPYGFFSDDRNRRFVDGGLYDNSGAITAKEIVDKLNAIIDKFNGNPNDLSTINAKARELIKQRKIRVIPMAIVDKKAVELNSDYANPAFGQPLGFRWIAWSPVEAVLSSREARLQKATDQLLKNSQQQPSPQPLPQQKQQAPQPSSTEARRVLLQKEFRLGGERNTIFSVPLGWKISCQARAFINDQLQPDDPLSRNFRYRPIPCDTPQKNTRNPVVAKRDLARSNKETFDQVINQLRVEVLNPSLLVHTPNKLNTATDAEPAKKRLEAKPVKLGRQ